jgi:hypothetical protein
MLAAALRRLRQALNYARDLGQDPWDFAVEIQDLFREGLSHNDFRWLLCKGYILHAAEVTEPCDKRRSFRPSGSSTFGERSCFVMTEEGMAVTLDEKKEEPAGHSTIGRTYFDGNRHSSGNGYLNGHSSEWVAESANGIPIWDKQRLELRLGRLLVKSFKVPAANQELVLAAFQEEGWPTRIDDPIPPRPDQDSKRRLHDTINALNRCQRNALIRFQGDGSGQGVRWEPSRLKDSLC